jgi:hypothetical protein
LLPRIIERTTVENNYVMIRYREKAFAFYGFDKLDRSDMGYGVESDVSDLTHSLKDRLLKGKEKRIKRGMRRDKDNSSLLTNRAKLQGIKQERFQNDLKHRMQSRSLQRAAEEKDLLRARAIEDKNGTGNSLKRGIQDATRGIKHGIQDMSDKYFESTSGRSLGGDLALAGLATGAGYLAVKAIKKARYDRQQAKEQAEGRYNTGMQKPQQVQPQPQPQPQQVQYQQPQRRVM